MKYAILIKCKHCGYYRAFSWQVEITGGISDHLVFPERCPTDNKWGNQAPCSYRIPDWEVVRIDVVQTQVLF